MLSQPGAYVLTGNLDNPSENTIAIEITAERVHLDLNGFRIKGTNVCGEDTTCP
ncbi:hypothetical protein [Elongatibacter sediminis]|uniref:Uncharacterized protein n=1 Tax=Elongatibacter sediminis TaxID=3119006 RepID=A0AAW9RMC5_9GAMM